jgi:hypothetical protein
MRRAAPIVVAVIAALWNPLPATAIQDGTTDTTPYRYPNVVCVWATDGGCGTGQLIGRRVVLTAAHVIAGPGAVAVSPDATMPLDADVSSMIPVVRAAIHPDWFGRSGWQHDIGVLILQRPVNGVPLVEIPTAGLLDDLRARYGSLDKVPGGFTGVGYGLQRDADGNTILDPQRRRYGPAYLDGLPDPWLNHNLKLSGVWEGDSGSCVFLADTYTCVGVVFNTRLDTPSARSFLAEFIPVP